MRVFRKAVFALAVAGAFAALATASASAASYKSETAVTAFTAVNEGTHIFKGGVTVECTSLTGKGEFTNGATSLTMTSVAYAGCKAAGQPVTVNMNGCDYKHGEPTGASSPYTVKTITIECSAGKEIVITVTTAGCTIKVPAQTTTGTSTITNNAGPPKTETLAANISGIKYTGSGGVCGGPGVTGTYTGKTKFNGFTGSGHTISTGIFIG